MSEDSLNDFDYVDSLEVSQESKMERGEEYCIRCKPAQSDDKKAKVVDKVVLEITKVFDYITGSKEFYEHVQK